MSSTFEFNSDLKIGNIAEVSGTSIRVELSGDVTELARTFDGRVYSIGQIGSIVKVHFGRRLIFGFVTLLRMRPEEMLNDEQILRPETDQRIMEVELFGEGVWNQTEDRLKFNRGVSTYPLPRQPVHLLTESETSDLYTAAESAHQPAEVNPLIAFASYVGAGNTSCHANLDKMLGMHCAVLGSTGSGKSGAVAALLHSMLTHQATADQRCRPRAVVMDPHCEYGRAFGSRAEVYRAYDPIGNVDNPGSPIQLPYWLMSADEFRGLVIGKTEHEATSQHNVIYKALTHARMVSAKVVVPAPQNYGVTLDADEFDVDTPRLMDGIFAADLLAFDRDKPRPFSLAELESHIRFVQAARFKGKTRETEQVPAGQFVEKYQSILDKLTVLRRDPRISFMMREWVDGDGDQLSLAGILAQLVGDITDDAGASKDLRILDISGLPNEVAGPLTAMVARLLFQYKLFQTDAERERDPVLLVCEEAHRYVPDRGEAEYSDAQSSIRRIAREGRKYGIGLMLVSQRPADVERTVISQCGTWLVLRLTNAADQRHVSKFLPDGLSGMTRVLPSLAQQEALFVGEGAAMPARIRIRDLSDAELPKSSTARFAHGWCLDRLTTEELGQVADRMTT